MKCAFIRKEWITGRRFTRRTRTRQEGSNGFKSRPIPSDAERAGARSIEFQNIASRYVCTYRVTGLLIQQRVSQETAAELLDGLELIVFWGVGRRDSLTSR